MSDTRADGFTEEERAAMKERAQELKGSKGKGAGKADDEGALLAKIAEMPEADRVLAERVHAVVTAEAPELSPKTWYGMPGTPATGRSSASSRARRSSRRATRRWGSTTTHTSTTATCGRRRSP